MTFPNQVFEVAARKTGVIVKLLWEIKGPKDTDIAWMSAYAVNGRVAIVQTYKSGGWDVYTAGDSNGIDDSINDALTRCCVPDKLIYA